MARTIKPSGHKPSGHKSSGHRLTGARSAKHILARRTMLRGLAGGTVAALALPTLEAMLSDNGDAYADGTPLPRRLVTWSFGNGCRLEHWVPSSQGTNYAMTEELAPLEGVKGYCNVLSGFHNKVAGRRGHHDGMAGCFSGYPFINIDPMGAPYASKFGGPSIDQVIADHIGGNTFTKSLAVGVSKRHNTQQGPTLLTMSHRGPDQPIVAERNPRAVYDMLFNSFNPDDPNTGMRVNSLDVVRSDAKRLMAKVSQSDRQRLDAHLEGVYQLQKQLLAVPPTCEFPLPPDDFGGPPEGDEPLTEVNALMSDLIAMAFSCDLTRVVSFMFTGSSGGTQFHMLPPSAFPEIGGNLTDYSHADHHSVSHVNSPYEQAFIHKSVVVTMQHFAHLLGRLRDQPEGDGNVLDNSCVFMTSGVTEGWSHSEDDYPIIVAGGAGGAIKHLGHFRSPNGRSVSDILLAVMQSVAPEAEITEVGGDDGNYDGRSTTPFTEMLTGR